MYVHTKDRTGYQMTLNMPSTDSTLVFSRWHHDVEPGGHLGGRADSRFARLTAQLRPSSAPLP